VVPAATTFRKSRRLDPILTLSVPRLTSIHRIFLLKNQPQKS
jgi:hypothetical protein